MRRSGKTKLFVAALAGLGIASPSVTVGQTWVGQTSGNWSDGSRWSGGVPVPGDSTSLTFGATGTASYAATNDIGQFALNAIAFNNAGTGTITIAGQGLTLSGPAPAFNVQAGAVTVSNVLSGASTLDVTGAGTLTLSGANTYTGGTSLSSGTLVLGGPTVSSAAVATFPTGTVTSSPVGTGAITFQGGGLSVAGANRSLRNAINVSGAANVINVPTGLELTTTNNIVGGLSAGITKTGSGIWRIADAGNASDFGTFGGTLTVNGGTVLLTDPTNADGTGGIGGDLAATNIVVNSGGKFQFGTFPAYNTENPDLPSTTFITVNTGGVVEWNVGEDFGGVVLDGGTIFTRTNMNFQVSASFLEPKPQVDLRSGAITSTGTGGVGGTFGGSQANTINKTTAGTVTITGVQLGGTGNQPINIQEGVLATNAAIAGTTAALSFGTGSTAGTLRYYGTANQSITRPLLLNTGGGTIEVATSAATVSVTGDVTGDGPLAKTGPGTLTLSGALSNSGNITASGGTLSLTGALNHTGIIRAAAGGTVRVNPVMSTGSFAASPGGVLAVNTGAGTASLGMAGLNLTGAGSTLRFDLATAAVPAIPLVSVTNPDGFTRTGTGVPTLSVTNTGTIANGTYQLIDYAGTPITSGLSVALPGRTAGSLVYNTADTRIDLTVSGTDTVAWTGAVNSTWDVGSAAGVGGTNNFKLASSGTPTNFINTDVLGFDDSTSVRTVNVTGSVQPFSATVTTDGTYTFQGTGSIAGGGSLIKQGAGTLVVATDNTYSGATTVTSGTLQVGAGGTAGTLGTGATSVATGATLTFNRSDTSTYNGNVSGTGSMTKDGAGTIVLEGSSNAFTGTLTINAGTVRVADDLNLGGDFGAASIVVNNGGKFEFAGPTGNPDMPESAAGGTVVTVNPGGVAEFTEGEVFGGLALKGGTINASVGMGITNATGTVARTVLESGTINNIAGVAGEINNVGIIRKTTAGTVTVTGVAINTTGAISLEQGVLSTDSDVLGTVGTLTFGTSSTAGTLQYRGAAGAIARPVSLVAGGGGGTIDVTQASGLVTLSGQVSGDGPFAKAGSGTLSLTADNSYTGTTTVTGGRLLVNNPTLTASGTGTGPVIVAAGATLGGSGSVGGTLSITGTLAPGNSAGALTLASSTAMNAGSVFQVELGKATGDAGNPAAGTDYDQVVLTGSGATLTLAAGAKLSVVELANLKVGQAFKVVDNTGTGTIAGTFSTVGGAPLPEGGTVFSNNGSSFAISYVGNDVTLTALTVVPEPAAAGLLAATGLLVLGRRRR